VQINICTAPAVVLESLAENLNGEYTPELLASERKNGCFPDLNSFRAIVGPQNLAAINGWYGETSQYFRLTTHVTLGTTEFTLYSLLRRGPGGKVTPLLRSFGTL
jgi:general secretion pathway protein K